MGNYPEGVELEDRPCPLGCAPKDYLVLEGQDILHGIPGTYQVVRCAHCDLMRTNPRPTPRTIGVYYPADYGPYASATVAQPVDSAGWKQKIKNLLRLESKKLPEIAPGRMLEIGCASGSYLAEMRKSGWTVEGIEFSESAAQEARSKGIPVQCATVENANEPRQRVDVIAAWMVLEHLHEPVEALKRIRSWTRPGGYLIASVPDGGAALGRVFGSSRYELQLPTHLYHYTPETLEKLLRVAGWEIERIYWQKNCNNLLQSLGYVATAHGWEKLAATTAWIRTSKKAAKVRILLSWILGVTRQSGRIEFWARPKE
jgi:SAM-dependent methyltransferase